MKMMKRVLWLLPVLGLGAIAIPTNVSAQCAQIGTSVQTVISGSQRPSTQTSDTSMRSGDDCTGSYSHTHTDQRVIGGSRPSRQEIKDEQVMKSGAGNASGVKGPTVKIEARPTFDIYNAADRE